MTNLTALADALRSLGADLLGCNVCEQAAAHFDILAAADEKMPVVAWLMKTGHGDCVKTAINEQLQKLKFGGVPMWAKLVRATDAQAAIIAATAPLQAELDARRKSGSASDRLHNICDALSEDRGKADQYTVAALEEADAENVRKQQQIAELKAEVERLRKDAAVERESRLMFAARLENMQKNGDPWREGADMTDEQIDALWLYRKDLHSGKLLPQLRDFARATLSAAAPEIRRVERERIIVECVPGGTWCDPQQVADAIRSLPDAP